ncbi:MAG: hypothetical protein LBN29_06830 [Mediterranea sp.]|nr:hypothetical protein [Mediterranea sp.]
MTLISSPAKAWEEISVIEDRREVFMGFVYPMIGLCGLSVFIGALIANGWGDALAFQTAMTQCCAVVVAWFGGYFLAAYAINRIGTRWFGLWEDMPLAWQFTGYGLVVPLVLQIILGLLPDFKVIVWVLQFYTVYVVWEGVPVMTTVKETARLRYTLLVSALLLICPQLILLVFNWLTTTLN